MGLLNAILGTFDGGPRTGSSGDQLSTLPADPYGNLAGALASGVPLPRPRPPEAGPPAFSPSAVSPSGSIPSDLQPDESDGTDGGLVAAPGLDPGRAKTVMASLAGGLSKVKNSPFAGQVAANAAGGAIAGGNKAEDTAIEQGIKLERVKQRGTGRLIDPSMRLRRADATSEQWYRNRVASLRDEQRAINQSPQTPEERAEQYKSVQERARALVTEFMSIRAQNRRAHGLSDDGTPLLHVAGGVSESAAPTSSASAATEPN